MVEGWLAAIIIVFSVLGMLFGIFVSILALDFYYNVFKDKKVKVNYKDYLVFTLLIIIGLPVTIAFIIIGLVCLVFFKIEDKFNKGISSEKFRERKGK